MKPSQYGPCGLYCGACGATDCDGCRSDRTDDWVRDCMFRKCARERNIASCCHCGDYPCGELHAFMHDKWPHHGPMERNLAYIKEHGVEKWLEQQKQEWSCRNCGAEITWYQKKCGCGKQLEAWVLPVESE